MRTKDSLQHRYFTLFFLFSLIFVLIYTVIDYTTLLLNFPVMKRINSFVFLFILFTFFSLQKLNAQSFGPYATAVWMKDCKTDNFFNVTNTRTADNLIGPAANNFVGKHFGVHTQNSGTLVLRGGEVKTYKNVASSNVCGANLRYRIYQVSATPGSFSTIAMNFFENCDVGQRKFAISGGPCGTGDQKWQKVIPDGSGPINLTTYPPGNYVIEIYFDFSGSFTSTTACDDVTYANNGANNYKAFFSIQAPAFASTNPTTCNGTEGTITISGLAPDSTYSFGYKDDGVQVGPTNVQASATGTITVTGLNAGTYNSFSLGISGCSNTPATSITLVNPVYTPTFDPIPAFCSGTTAPTLPATSTNGFTGTWNPATIDNQNNGTYTFTPTAGQCATTATLTVTVTPNVTPTFSFGTTLTVCSGATVPTLPVTSQNSVTGTWSPATIDNQNNGTYTFTPTEGQCATTTTLTVTITPKVTPTFSFGTSLQVCASVTPPVLPTTSQNGVTGTWSPATIDNQNNGTYTFTPTAGLCANSVTLTVTATQTISPVFLFPAELTICAGSQVPSLPNTAENGITGTWNPATVNNQNNGTYTFTPSVGQCASGFTLTVTVTPKVTPTFSFGTSFTICAGSETVSLPGTSQNGITGTWNPSTIDNQNNGTYTFTPSEEQCATSATLTVTVTPKLTPAFSFGTALSICAGANVPSLPTNSQNGVAGSWSPSTIDNQNNGTYTFTPDEGQCANTTTLTVTVTPNVTPTFGFGSEISFCAGSTAPILPLVSVNNITGTWSPVTINNQQSGTYTFTPAAGQCATQATLTVTVNQKANPSFGFGSTLTICSGDEVPSLPEVSNNDIGGSWSPSTINNQQSGTYTFRPNEGICANTFTLTVTVNQKVTAGFNFGTSLSICAGATVPSLPQTSANNVSGTWSPATINNQQGATYTFTPSVGQCATGTTLTVTVNPIPTVVVRNDTTVYDGAQVPGLIFTGTPGNVSFNWVNSNTSIGLGASGSGNVPSFTATNRGNDPITGTITVTPTANGCTGATGRYTITVRPLNKDVFVPNVFSPNGDGRNDVLFVYGNYITKLEFRIFNQWGEQMIDISNRSQGWDGTFKGKPQPTGVYVYVLRATLADGRTIDMKGSITLLR